jgi:hypothetical protein
MSCYRDTSVLMHAGVAALDAAKHVRAGRPIQAAVTLFNRGVVASLGAAIETAPLIRLLSRGRPHRDGISAGKRG